MKNKLHHCGRWNEEDNDKLHQVPCAIHKQMTDSRI